MTQPVKFKLKYAIRFLQLHSFKNKKNNAAFLLLFLSVTSPAAVDFDDNKLFKIYLFATKAVFFVFLTLNFQLSTLNSQLSTYNLQLSTLNSQLSTLNSQLTAYNLQLKT